MVKAVKRSTAEWKYVLTCDRGLEPAEQSTFVLRPMSMENRARATDSLTRSVARDDGTREVQGFTRQVACSIALSHIVRVENFPAEHPAPWPEDLDDRRVYLQQLNDDDVLELGNEVFRGSQPIIDTKAPDPALPGL